MKGATVGDSANKAAMGSSDNGKTTAGWVHRTLREAT